MRTQRVLGVCAALVVVSSGCSSSSSEDGRVTTAVAEPATSTTAVTTTAPTSATSSTTTAPAVGGIDGLVAANEPAGVGAVFVGAFGETSADVSAAGVDGDGNPVTPDRAWETASLVKMIVATSILQLVDLGLVELDAPVGSYVDVPIAESIRVRDVLSHRSGIADMTDHLSSCPTEATLEVMKQRAESATAPLSETSYSNTNYLLLGYLVGQVTGQDVAEYARQSIFEPLGMESTYWWETQDGPAVYWKLPVSDPGGISPFTCPDLDVTVGTEGLTFVSTLDDLDVLLRGLFGGDLVSTNSLGEMLPSESEEDGLGIWAERDDERGVTLYGHFGGRSGFSTVAYYDPENDRSVVAFAHDPTDVDQLMWQAWDIADEQGW